MKEFVLVTYYSRNGRSEALAKAIAAGLEEAGLEPKLVPAEQLGLGELRQAKGLAVGSPAYFSNMAWPVKKLIDESIQLYGGRELAGVPFLAFATAGCERDGQKTMELLQVAFTFHHEMADMGSVLALDSEPSTSSAARAREAGFALGKAILDRG